MSACPKCKAPTLNFLAMADLRRKLPGRPQRCSNCQGLWLKDHSEASALVELVEDGPLDSDEQGLGADARGGLCPEGHGILIRARVDGEETFFLDRCSACGGIWFDAGELARIAERHLVDSLEMLWTSAWQRRQRQEQSREFYLSALENEVGSDLFCRLVEVAALIRTSAHRQQILAFLRQESQPAKELPGNPPAADKG